MSEIYNQIVEVLAADVCERFGIEEEEMEGLSKEWKDMLLEMLEGEEPLRCSPCVECGNMLCLGDLCS